MERKDFKPFFRYFIGDEASNFRIQHLRNEKGRNLPYRYGEKVTVDYDAAQGMNLFIYPDPEAAFDELFNDHFSKKAVLVGKKDEKELKKEAVVDAVRASIGSGELPPQEAEVAIKSNLKSKSGRG